MSKSLENKEQNKQETLELIKIEKDLENKVNFIFPHLRTSFSSHLKDRKAEYLGKKKSANFNFSKGIKKEETKALLGFSR